jgi:hypothetical protein
MSAIRLKQEPAHTFEMASQFLHEKLYQVIKNDTKEQGYRISQGDKPQYAISGQIDRENPRLVTNDNRRQIFGVSTVVFYAERARATIAPYIGNFGLRRFPEQVDMLLEKSGTIRYQLPSLKDN